MFVVGLTLPTWAGWNSFSGRTLALWLKSVASRTGCFPRSLATQPSPTPGASCTPMSCPQGPVGSRKYCNSPAFVPWPRHCLLSAQLAFLRPGWQPWKQHRPPVLTALLVPRPRRPPGVLALPQLGRGGPSGTCRPGPWLQRPSCWQHCDQMRVPSCSHMVSPVQRAWALGPRMR